MAEATSPAAAGEESSEDEEVSDEASPTLGGLVSPIGRSSNKKKKLRYVREYLLRVPKHQRRKIQKEIDNGYKPGEMKYKINIICAGFVEGLMN